MIQSQLILDIFELLFDELGYEALLKKQIPFLSIGSKDHTKVGAFIYFDHEKGIESFRVQAVGEPGFDSDGNLIARIDGVELHNDKLMILADTTVHLKNGLIDCLEIWNKNGEDYPVNEPEVYRLEQVWKGKAEKRTIIRGA